MKRISMMVHCSIRSITIRRGKSTKAMKKAKKTRVIPGYHLTFGIVITLLSLIVLIPLASVLVYALKLSPGEWFRLIMKENVRNAFLTSVGCSFLAAVINTVFGLILAWTLVKYEFPGKKLLDSSSCRLRFRLRLQVSRFQSFLRTVDFTGRYSRSLESGSLIRRQDL
jgi:ABC-type Fe3+ transport system permease subunit